MATVLQAAVRNTTRVSYPRVARVGVEPTESPGLSRAALPVCVPCRLSHSSAPGGIRTRDLLADNEASTPGCSTKASSMAQEGLEPSASLVLSESGLPIAYRAENNCINDSVPRVGFEPTGARV